MYRCSSCGGLTPFYGVHPHDATGRAAKGACCLFKHTGPTAERLAGLRLVGGTPAAPKTLSIAEALAIAGGTSAPTKNAPRRFNVPFTPQDSAPEGPSPATGPADPAPPVPDSGKKNGKKNGTSSEAPLFVPNEPPPDNSTPS